jgi:glycosidase
MIKQTLLGLWAFSMALGLYAQNLEKVEPAFWWVGMKNPNLQLLIYGKNIGQTQASLSYPGVKLIGAYTVENPNYLFVNLEISPQAQAGTFEIQFHLQNKKIATYNYTLKSRKPRTARPISSQDVVYLIMPDRFANGNPANDNHPQTTEKADRTKPGGRHGGDIKGMSDRLDYLKNLGVTAIWHCPVLENNSPQYSYHGYAITDFYKIDPRHGSNEEYAAFVAKAHEKGMKVIKDLVFNHIGSEHIWMKQTPTSNWINGNKTYSQTNYHNPTATDPHASGYDLNRLHNGWFVESMPDLNQKNEYLANYLIQHSIFWIEYADLDGIRMDTYPYPDREFMARWNREVLEQYPNFYIVGEVWVDDAVHLSYWQHSDKNQDGYRSNLFSVTDFPLYGGFNSAFGGGYTYGLYKVLNQDFLYQDPNKLLIFLDNHDTDRALGIYNGNIAKLKMALATLLTTRGVPQIFYGLEALFDQKGDHGLLRADFPGGWPDDKVSLFESKGLTQTQKDFGEYLKKLLHWRKTAHLVHSGKLTHFIPRNDSSAEELNTYVYFRHSEKGCIMVIINNQDKAHKLSGKRFSEFLDSYQKAKDVISGKTFQYLNSFDLEPNTAYILELE